MAFWMLWCPNALCHINLDVSAAPWGRDNIFGIFGVRHANRGRTKYGIYNCPFFIWHLNCDERCWIRNVILHFIAPNLRAITALLMGQNWSYPNMVEPLKRIWPSLGPFFSIWHSLALRKLPSSFFFLHPTNTLVPMQLGNNVGYYYYFWHLYILLIFFLATSTNMQMLDAMKTQRKIMKN